MKTLNEVIEDNKFYNMHRIDEMATISRPADNLPKSTKICIYGENDEQGTKVPHFHVVIDNGDIELEVHLKHIHDLNIWRTKKNYPKSWDGLANVKEKVSEWLNKKNVIDPSKTNTELMVITWNLNNPSNEIDKDFVGLLNLSEYQKVEIRRTSIQIAKEESLEE